MPGKRPPLGMSLYTLDQLRVANLPPPQPIMEGLLNEGETILLVGRPKAGKSRLVQQATLDLARGKPFLGHFQVPQARRVLLIDLENRPAGVKARFSLMSPPDESDNRISIYAPDTLIQGGVNATTAGIQTLESYVNQSGADVVVIDIWRLFVGGEENDSRVTVDALKYLSYIRQKRPHLGNIIVHHLRKEKNNGLVRLRDDPYTWVESVSGHHALVGHADACFGLEREFDSNGEERIIFGGVARSSATTTLTLEEDDQTLLFKVQSGLDAALAVFTPRELSLYNEASALKKFKFTELVTKSGTTNKKAVSSMLRKAKACKIVEQHGEEYVTLY